MAVELQRMTAGDAPRFDRIAPDVFDEPIRAERLDAYLREPNHLMILAFDKGLVVGQCSAVLHKHPDKTTELYVDEVGTAATHRRQGIAMRLVDAMFAWGRELGCTEAWLGTDRDNIAANGLYRKLGGSGETIVYYEFALAAPRRPDDRR